MNVVYPGYKYVDQVVCEVVTRVSMPNSSIPQIANKRGQKQQCLNEIPTLNPRGVVRSRRSWRRSFEREFPAETRVWRSGRGFILLPRTSGERDRHGGGSRIHYHSPRYALAVAGDVRSRMKGPRPPCMATGLMGLRWDKGVCLIGFASPTGVVVGTRAYVNQCHTVTGVAD